MLNGMAKVSIVSRGNFYKYYTHRYKGAGPNVYMFLHGRSWQVSYVRDMVLAGVLLSGECQRWFYDNYQLNRLAALAPKVLTLTFLFHAVGIYWPTICIAACSQAETLEQEVNLTIKHWFHRSYSPNCRQFDKTRRTKYRQTTRQRLFVMMYVLYWFFKQVSIINLDREWQKLL